MEWNVKNALSRDVEREHLNKILKEIKSTVDSINSSTVTREQIKTIVTNTVQGSSSAPPPSVSFKITLDGNVTGTGSVVNGNDVTITTTVDPSILGIPDAPMDSLVYWRGQGQWQEVPGKLTSLVLVDGDGYLHYTDENGWVVMSASDVSADINTRVMEAGTTIHGRRAVSADLNIVYHPDLSIPVDGVRIIGITTQAGGIGDEVGVQTSGPMTNAGWAWSAGPVFVDDGGVLTQTAPSAGWVVRVGTAIAADTIDINVMLTILRS